MRALIVTVLLFAVWPLQAAVTNCDDATGMAGAHACEKIDLLSHLPIDQMGGSSDRNDNGDPIEWVSDMWGWVDDQGTADAADDREYAIVGRFCGTSFIDITDPENPVYLGNLPDHSEFQEGYNDCQAITAGHGKMSAARYGKLHETDGSIWRDIKVYDHYALIVAETNIGNSSEPRAGMQIFDLHQLRGLAAGSIPVTFARSSYTHYSGFGNSHNVFVNQLTGRAYAAGSDQCSGGPQVIDISDPASPIQTGCYAAEGYTHDIQCVIYSGPDDGHVGKEICIGSNGNVNGPNTLVILDVTDPANIATIAEMEYPSAAYSHQAWFSEDQKYVFHNDELDEYYGVVYDYPATGAVKKSRLLVWDVTDLDNPVLKTEFSGRTGSTDHNNYVQGKYLYQSNYTAGLNILDISNPEAPAEAGYFDTFIPFDVVNREDADTTNDDPFMGTWSNYPWYPSETVAVSDITGGLFLLKPDFTSITSANVNVSVRALSDEVEVGDAVTFEMIVASNGPDPTTGLNALLKLSNGTLESVDTGSSGAACVMRTETVLTCTGLELSAGGNYVVEIDATAGTEGNIVAQAYATANDVDTDRMDNSDRAGSVVAKPGSGGGDGGGDGDGDDSGGGGTGFWLLAGLLLMLNRCRRPA